MPDTLTEHLGDCCISYMAETPVEYRQRTGEYVGGQAPRIIGAIHFYMAGKPAGYFFDIAEARLHLNLVANIASAYPMPERN